MPLRRLILLAFPELLVVLSWSLHLYLLRLEGSFRHLLENFLLVLVWWLVIGLWRLVDFSGAVRALSRVVAVRAVIGPTLHPKRALSTALRLFVWMVVYLKMQIVQDISLHACLLCLLFNHEWQRSTPEIDFGLQDNLFGSHGA